MSAIAGVWGRDYTQQDDRELLARIRAGDSEAYAELWRRHLPAAYAVAHRHRGRTSADDIVGEASLRVYDLIRCGKGPTSNFRSYFLAAVRSVAVDAARTELRVVPTQPDALEAAAGTVLAHDVEGRVDQELARAAFRRLSERDQQVLWQTAVEGRAPAVAASTLGMTPNGVSVAASRARESLRARYLDAHADRGVSRAKDEECRWVLSLMGRYVRGKLPARQRTKVQRHLSGCHHAQGLMREMSEVNRGLSALVVPLVLIGASSAGLSWAGTWSGLGALHDPTVGTELLLGHPGSSLGSTPETLGHAMSGSAGAATGGAPATGSVGAVSAGGVAGAAGPASAAGAVAGATAVTPAVAVGTSAAASIAAKVAALAAVGTLASPFVAGVPVDGLGSSEPGKGHAVSVMAPEPVAESPGLPMPGADPGSGPGQPAADGLVVKPAPLSREPAPTAGVESEREAPKDLPVPTLAPVGGAPAGGLTSDGGSGQPADGTPPQSPVPPAPEPGAGTDNPDANPSPASPTAVPVLPPPVSTPAPSTAASPTSSPTKTRTRTYRVHKPDAAPQSVDGTSSASKVCPSGSEGQTVCTRVVEGAQ